jgi:hypothetical protein
MRADLPVVQCRSRARHDTGVLNATRVLTTITADQQQRSRILRPTRTELDSRSERIRQFCCLSDLIVGTPWPRRNETMTAAG